LPAAISLNKSERRWGTFKPYSLRPQNLYRWKGTGEWKTTEYYFPEDLPKLMLVLQKAYEYVALTESNGQGGVAGADA